MFLFNIFDIGKHLDNKYLILFLIFLNVTLTYLITLEKILIINVLINNYKIFAAVVVVVR